jgi:hypothetical protein
MNNETTAAIRAAFKTFDDRGSFLWKYAEPIWEDYCGGGDDPEVLVDPVRRGEFEREAAEFNVGFAERHEDARLTLVEALKAAEPAAPSDKRLWNNFCAAFHCFDRDMATRWKALTVVLDHYSAHLPDDPVKLAEHYREMGMLAHDFAVKVGHERRRLGLEIEQGFGPMPTPWWCD